MATFSKVKLSGSTDGKAIRLTASTSPGTTIHTTGTASAIIDEIWLYAYNSSASAQTLTIQFGGTATPDDDIRQIIPSQSGLTLIVPGLILNGTGSAGNTVAGYAGGSAVTISGYVNRIS